MRHQESHFQIAVVRMLRTAGFYCFAVPNGTQLKLSQARIAKAEGMLSGVSDLIILLPKGKSVFVELKNPYGRWSQSENQKDFQREAEARGFSYLIWNSWPQVENFINTNRDK